jgi:hypothetical protein
MTNLVTENQFGYTVIASPPEPDGYWEIGGGYSTYRFAIYKKVTDQQIKNTEELLGWKWIDGKVQEK